MMLSKWRLKESRLLSEGRRGLPMEIGDLRPLCAFDDSSDGLKGKQSPNYGSSADRDHRLAACSEPGQIQKVHLDL